MSEPATATSRTGSAVLYVATTRGVAAFDRSTTCSPSRRSGTYATLPLRVSRLDRTPDVSCVPAFTGAAGFDRSYTCSFPPPRRTAIGGPSADGSDSSMLPGAVAVCCELTTSSGPGFDRSNTYTPVGASTAYAIGPEAATSREYPSRKNDPSETGLTGFEMSM